MEFQESQFSHKNKITIEINKINSSKIGTVSLKA